MNLGDTILNYRKKENLSQEDLAREVGVTRQTISKWELNETSPDLKQSIKLAKIFKISLDEFTNNTLINTQKRETKIKKLSNVIVYICLALLFIFLIVFITLFVYESITNSYHESGTIGIVCTLDEEEYGYAITYDNTNDIIMVDGSPYVFDNIYKTKKYKNAITLITDVKNYFKERGGNCE